VVIALVLENGVDAGEESAEVEEAGRGDHAAVRLDQVLQGAEDVEDAEVGVADALRRPCGHCIDSLTTLVFCCRSVSIFFFQFQVFKALANTKHTYRSKHILTIKNIFFTSVRP
jgi:hypothetical protein